MEGVEGLRNGTWKKGFLAERTVVPGEEGLNGYPCLDLFRLAAALLVIAIHTSPLASYSAFGDFLLTRILGRTAVPFFFMVTGFFLYGGDGFSRDKLLGLIKKTGKLYLISVLLYLPINWYTGGFKRAGAAAVFLKGLLVDGTMYHLWYLPAVITGSALTYFGVRYLSAKGAFILSFFLYVFGLLGDSYYGLAAEVPFLKNLFSGLFHFMDYTRNGLFFAPVFLTMGMVLREKGRESGWQAARPAALAVVPAVILMAAEGTVLREFKLMRHDSMYVMLLPVMFLLFSLLLVKRGRAYKCCRDISMAVYIIHPWIIILVRRAARVLGITKWAVRDSLMHFLLVALFSFLAGTAYYHLKKVYGTGRRKSNE